GYANRSTTGSRQNMRFAKSLFKDSREQHRFPYRFDDTFCWLSEQPSHRHNIATGAKRTLSRQWANILKESGRKTAEHRVSLPVARHPSHTTNHSTITFATATPQR
ncbi:MAG: hypothetical protein ACKO9Q_14000, partial [Pirellula sp.]